MLSTALLACNNTNDTITQTTTNTTPSTEDLTTSIIPEETAAPTTDADGYLLDSLPEDMNFNGETVGILTWEDVERPEFEALEINGDIVNDAIFNRNANVSERLGVTFEWYGVKGNNNHISEYVATVRNSVQAGDKAYDIYAGYSRSIGSVAVNGFSYDFNEVQHLDFDKPWWPQRMRNAFDINGDLYFISGDISTNLLHFMYGIYYNKDMIAEYKLTDPTEFVLNGTWTLDKMMEMTTGIYQDLNNNATVDYNDRFGMTTLYFHLDALYTGSGLRLVEVDPEKTLVISPDFASEKAINLADKIGPWAATNDFLYGVDDGTYENSFVQNNALFCLNRMYLADKKLRDVTFTYSVLPVPKYDEQQESYITVMGNPFTLYSIAIDCDNPDMAAATIEALGSAGYRMTSPAIFEINMKTKYSSDDINSQMFDIIRAGVDFDLGRIFAASLNNMSELPSKTMWANQSWATAVKTHTKVLNTLMSKIVENLNTIR